MNSSMPLNARASVFALMLVFVYAGLQTAFAVNNFRS